MCLMEKDINYISVLSALIWSATGNSPSACIYFRTVSRVTFYQSQDCSHKPCVIQILIPRGVHYSMALLFVRAIPEA